MKTYWADLGYGKSCKAFSLSHARKLGAKVIHEYKDGALVRTVFCK